jgi:hypothetical protein
MADERRSVEDQILDLLRQIGDESSEALNRGDFEAAFGYLPDDFEWHPADEMPERRVLRGPREIASYFREIREVLPDWRSVERDYRLVGGNTVLVHHRMSGTGGLSGIGIGRDIFQVIEIGDDGVPRRLREFFNRAEAERAAGLSD